MSIDKSESIKELAIALAKAQAAIRPALKDSENPHFRSKYADLSSVWDACRKPLTDNGLSVMQMPVDAGDGRVALTTMILHTSGEYITSTVSTRLQKDDAQGVGSALTYLRRYALSSAIGVVADDDDDGNHASAKPAQSSQARAASYATPPRTGPVPAPSDGSRRELMDRAMGLYATLKEAGLKYKGKMFKEMDIPEMRAAIATMEKQIDEITAPGGGIEDEWDEIDQAASVR